MNKKLTYEELSKGKINHLQLIQKAGFLDSAKQEEDEKIKYQNIRYYKDNGFEPSIDATNSELIDYFKAKNEIKKIDWKYESNFIGFENHDTLEILQMVRLEENEWYVENLIGGGFGAVNWEGYIWFCQISTDEVLSLVHLFFEEAHWFRTQNWTLKKIKI